MTDTIDDALPGGGRIQGHCAPAFRPVLEAFRTNFAEHREVGASVCLIHEGAAVVDLWGGMADPKHGQSWERDTVGIVYSCTKGAAALVAHMLAERGAVDMHADVARLWPEFAAGGKGGTTLVHMLSHTAPVPHVRTPVREGGVSDWNYMVDLIAAEPAFWAPGSRQGYHGLTYAWTVGQVVRLAAGKPLGQIFREEVAGPLGLDFWIGLPGSEEHRVAPMIAADLAEMNVAAPFVQALREPGSLPQLFLGNTGGANFNSRAIHAAEVASANGITNARGLAGMYAPLAAGGGGLVSEETLIRMGRVVAATMDDATLRQPTRFGLGFMASMDNRGRVGDSAILGETAFGHVGAGGSIGFADPVARLSFGYTMNRMGGGLLLNARGQGLVDAAYSALGWRSNASGAWRR